MTLSSAGKTAAYGTGRMGHQKEGFSTLFTLATLKDFSTSLMKRGVLQQKYPCLSASF
jgi:hypothetical protein